MRNRFFAVSDDAGKYSSLWRILAIGHLYSRCNVTSTFYNEKSLSPNEFNFTNKVSSLQQEWLV